MSLPQMGKIYTFTCMVFPDKKLNLYASHLHFEFHDGRYTGNGAGLPSKSYDAIGSTVNPYDKIAAIVS